MDAFPAQAPHVLCLETDSEDMRNASPRRIKGNVTAAQGKKHLL